MRYIASCSFGKDSLAMVLLLIEMGRPIDEVIFFNTGMEFEAIYNIRDRLIPILEGQGIKYTELLPQKSFLYNMLERPVQSKERGCHYGYGWCGGVCRWGTTEKNRIIDGYKAQIDDDIFEYVGIAADEAWRAKEKHYPLIDLGMTEADCLKSGIPDLCLPVARGGNHELYIELKRQCGGRISEEQVRWINGLLKQGYAAAICKGWQEAADVIIDYLRRETEG